MKVVHLVPAMQEGGVETVVLNLVRVGVERGWESVVVSRGGRLVPHLERSGGRHVALDVRSKNVLTYFARVRALRRVLARERPDLVCVHSRVPAWLFIRANRPLGLKWITYAHGANHVSAYSRVMTRGDLTVVPSHFLRDYLVTNYGLDTSRVRIIPPAVDTARFDPAAVDRAIVEQRRRAWGLAEGDFVVMTVGRITRLKGHDTLIREMARLVKTLPRAKLVIVGDADRRHRDYLRDLMRLAAREGLARRVIFAGGETNVPACLSLASVVVSANTTKPESFGLSMAEALAMDRPVVAKAFGGALDIVQNGVDGLLIRDDRFAPALEKVADGAFTGLRARALARFGLDLLSANTRACYDELVGAGRGGMA